MAQLLSNDSSAANVTSAAAPGSSLASTPWWALALLGDVAALLAIALVFTLIDSYCRYTVHQLRRYTTVIEEMIFFYLL